MSCCSYWILCTSCLTCWLVKLADRVFCYLCTFWPANVKYSVVCLPERCLYCYNCTVFLFRLTLSQWCNVRLYLLHALRSAQQEVHVCFHCYYPLHYFVNCLLLIVFSVKLIILLLGNLLCLLHCIYWPFATRPPLIRIRSLKGPRAKLVPAHGSITQSTLSVGGGNRGLSIQQHAVCGVIPCHVSWVTP